MVDFFIGSMLHLYTKRGKQYASWVISSLVILPCLLLHSNQYLALLLFQQETRSLDV